VDGTQRYQSITEQISMTTETRDMWSAGDTGALCGLSIKQSETVSVCKETQTHLYTGHIPKDYEMTRNLYQSKEFA
jgi:hypothetical protein